MTANMTVYVIFCKNASITGNPGFESSRKSGIDNICFWHERISRRAKGRRTASISASVPAAVEPLPHIGNRDLDPPESVVRIVAAPEEMGAR